jgi:hypothetical protein
VRTSSRRAADGYQQFRSSARGIVIRTLARFFRGLHLIFGVSAPPEGQNERTFVFVWLGVLAFLAAFGAFLIYLIAQLYFKQ